MQVQAGDIRLFFDVEGAKLAIAGPCMLERPTVLMLHGGPGIDHSSLRAVGAQLADIAQVIYLDHRGNGRSDRGPREKWTLAQWGDDVRAFCDALGIERPIILGASFGTFVALSYASRHPGHASKLILAGAAARFCLDRALAIFERLGGPEAVAVARRFYADPLPNFGDYIRVCMPLYSQTQIPGFEDALARTVVNFDVGGHFVGGEMQSFDLRADAAKITCPTLILSGAHDPITTAVDADELAAALPAEKTQLLRLPDVGHEVFAEAPIETLQAVRSFILKP
jgi:proline iminopeptidase